MICDSGRRAKRQDAKQGLVRKDARTAAQAASPTPIQDHPMTNKQTGTSGLVERLRDLLAKAGFTRLHIDEPFKDEFRIHDMPDNSPIAFFVADGLDESKARLIAEAINALPELLDRLASLSPVPVDEVERLREAGERVNAALLSTELVGFSPEIEQVFMDDLPIILKAVAALTASRPSDDGEVERLRRLAKGNNDLARMNGKHRDEWRQRATGLAEAMECIRDMISGCAGQPNLPGDVFKIADAALSSLVGEK